MSAADECQVDNGESAEHFTVPMLEAPKGDKFNVKLPEEPAA